MIFIDHNAVREQLDLGTGIALVREAMIALARGQTRQSLREILPLADGSAFSIMPGAIDGQAHGAKLINVIPGNWAKGERSHQGVIVLFEPGSGAVAALVDGGEVTGLRTAAASAVATAALARADATRLAILGTGEQAWRHAQAMAAVRPIRQIRLWGRSQAAAQAMAEAMTRALAIPAMVAATVGQCTADADIVCTTTGAVDPLLASADIRDGTHINAVGSSSADFAELAADLVARSRFIPDYRPGILAQGGEFLRARAAGLIDDSHVRAGIGDVLAGTAPGRTGADEVTVFKSIGHVVQDLACARWLLQRARAVAEPAERLTPAQAALL